MEFLWQAENSSNLMLPIGSVTARTKTNFYIKLLIAQLWQNRAIVIFGKLETTFLQNAFFDTILRLLKNIYIYFFKKQGDISKFAVEWT